MLLPQKNCPARPYTLFAIQLSPSFLRIVELQFEGSKMTNGIDGVNIPDGTAVNEMRTPDNTHIGQLKKFRLSDPFLSGHPKLAIFVRNVPATLPDLIGHINWPLQCQKYLEIIIFAMGSQKAQKQFGQIRPDSNYLIVLCFSFFLSSSMTFFTSGTSLFNNKNVVESPWESTSPVAIKVGDCERATRNWSDMIRVYSFTWRSDNCSGHSLNIASGTMHRTGSNNWTTMLDTHTIPRAHIMEIDFFDESKWVKSYNIAKIPAYVLEAKGKLLAIPAAFKTKHANFSIPWTETPCKILQNNHGQNWGVFRGEFQSKELRNQHGVIPWCDHGVSIERVCMA